MTVHPAEIGHIGTVVFRRDLIGGILPESHYDRSAVTADITVRLNKSLSEKKFTAGIAEMSRLLTAGRIKMEIRPMLLIEAEAGGKRGVVFLQDAETIRLACPDGTLKSVASLRPGDQVLCRLDEAGRHFGIRVNEQIMEA